MARVTLIQVYYNHRRFIDKVFPAALNQTYTDTEFIVVIAGNEDGGKEYIAEKYPQARIIDPGYNIGFAKGHNELFKTIDSEFFQLVNPDLILQPDYVEKMLAAFNDPKVGAATGKLLQYNFNEDKSTNIIDTTGVILYKTGRGRDRGQHEVDRGQYDHHRKVIAVSGAGPMYRKAALEAVKYVREDGVVEYFDQDFHTYWEDVDLALRMTNAGYDCWFVPGAVGYHGRGVASTKGGYKHVAAYVKHHRTVSATIRRWNYKNHIFLYLKNVPRISWKFFMREFFMLGYIIVFESRTLSVLPDFFRLLPKIWKKRKYIQQHRKISTEDFEKLFTKHATDIS